MAQRRTTATGDASALNPEAGSHRVTADPRELAAGMEAAERSWESLPYFEARFGERGWRFGVSDTGWLITLARMPKERAINEALWLGRVLSSRGMPQLCLEHHLELLRDALVAAFPGADAQYANLVHARKRLGRLRRSQIDERTLRTLAKTFDAVADELNVESHRRLGAMLVSAVADEGLGIPNAVPSLTDWACDARFPQPLIDAANATVAAARAARKNAPPDER